MATVKSSKAKVIDKVVEQARIQYEALLESQYVSTKMRIDGKETRGQIEEKSRKINTKEEQTRTVTCMLDVNVHRGSYIEIQNDSNDKGYSQKGIVLTIPQKTPVDFYFTALIFNTKAKRHRAQLIYDENGYVVQDNPLVTDEIDCFVQRIGVLERKVDAGIDRDSVNEIIATKDWDIKRDDILYIGSDTYKITDIKELDDEIFYGYMTYYRV